jgi:hypothetical protein
VRDRFRYFHICDHNHAIGEAYAKLES